MKYLGVADEMSQDGSEVLVVLIDLSPSMLTDDWKPTRLAGAIQANKELLKANVEKYPSDKIGIIGFGNKATLLHKPVCLRRGLPSLQNALRHPKEIPGTNFTAALELAESCLFAMAPRSLGESLSRKLGELLFDSTPYESETHRERKRIIKLTDGQHNHRSCPLGVASRLRQKGVVIDCIGIGGSPKDVDESLLKRIASVNPDGSIRYCFIGDKSQLIREYQTLARRISQVQEEQR
jgi:von Willebrand factor type A domain